MGLEHIKKFLKENGKGNPELSESFIDTAMAEAVEAAESTVRETEKTRYILEAKKIRTDIDKLKPFKAALEEAGFDGNGDPKDFILTLKTATETGKKAATEKTELEKQFSSLQSQMKTILENKKADDEEKDRLRQERKGAVLREKLMKDIGEKLVNGEDSVKILIHEGAVDLDESGKPVFKSGETVIAYDKGVKDFLKAREPYLKDKQTGGAHSAPGTKNIQARADMPLTDMLQLPKKGN
jgi:hypothetical protein